MDQIPQSDRIFENLSVDELVQQVLERNEAELSANGALCNATGERTGRSPNDRFIVEDEITQHTVDWGKVNQPIAVSDLTGYGHVPVNT